MPFGLVQELEAIFFIHGEMRYHWASIGYHPLEFDAEAFMAADQLTQEGDSTDGLLVGMAGGVAHAGVIVDGNEDVLPAGPAACADAPVKHFFMRSLHGVCLTAECVRIIGASPGAAYGLRFSCTKIYRY
jgi:hypothetical protein